MLLWGRLDNGMDQSWRLEAGWIRCMRAPKARLVRKFGDAGFIKQPPLVWEE